MLKKNDLKYLALPLQPTERSNFVKARRVVLQKVYRESRIHSTALLIQRVLNVPRCINLQLFIVLRGGI